MEVEIEKKALIDILRELKKKGTVFSASFLRRLVAAIIDHKL